MIDVNESNFLTYIYVEVNLILYFQTYMSVNALKLKVYM